jgi:hypothetical protein
MAEEHVVTKQIIKTVVSAASVLVIDFIEKALSWRELETCGLSAGVDRVRNRIAAALLCRVVAGQCHASP